MRLGATGIGAFYDDEVHRHLNLVSNQGQAVYHFAIGYPVPDPHVSASNEAQDETGGGAIPRRSVNLSSWPRD
jgi:hypothetical protein